jgi:hypothetical protein
MIDTTQALLSLKPNAEWIFKNNELIWKDTEQTEPTQSEIDAEVIRLQGEYDSQEYARLRFVEYNKLNQFEMQFDDQRDGTATWIDAINEIKTRFPK